MNLNKIEIVPFKFEKKKNTNQVDPYLDENDVKTLKNQSIGEGINIKYNNSDTSVKCNFDFSNDNDNDNDNDSCNDNDNDSCNDSVTNVDNKSSNENVISIDVKETHKEQVIVQKNNNSDNENTKTEEDYDNMTIKQKQIIQFLVKNQNHQQIHNKLFQILQKLQLMDLDGFSIHLINCEKINILIKEKLIKVIQIYKDNLIKKFNAGETHFNSIPIQKITELLIT